MTSGTIKALLCDVDGVVRVYDPARQQAVEAAHGIPAGTIYRLAFAADIGERLVTGALGAAEWQAGIADALAPWCADPGHASRAVEAWRTTSSVDHRVLALLAETARRIPVALVTNGTDRVEDELAALGVTAVVPRVVNSARLGFAKPDRRIFEHAAALLGVAPGGCLFVDDTAGHVAAAEALGMRGLHYRSAGHSFEALRTALGG